MNVGRNTSGTKKDKNGSTNIIRDLRFRNIDNGKNSRKSKKSTRAKKGRRRNRNPDAPIRLIHCSSLSLAK
jgi:hypothetical protein